VGCGPQEIPTLRTKRLITATVSHGVFFMPFREHFTNTQQHYYRLSTTSSAEAHITAYEIF
jgi:hypothetical protein